jgi:dCMP deaminase
MNITIGITGLVRAGKDEVAKILINHHKYQQFNMSDVLKEELIRVGKEPTKMNMSILGDEWRNLYGHDVVMRRTLERASNYKKIVITGIRDPAEIDFLKKNTDRFKLIAVNASKEIRFSRKFPGEPDTPEKFFARDERDIKNKGLDKVIEGADYVIENEESYEELATQLGMIIGKIEYKRPSWDEYFIEMANHIGKRGTCDRGRCGSVIVKGKHVLSTGYAGAPTGLKHCDHIGHQMKSTTHEDGRVSKHCVRTTHSEQNSICQAAKFGIPLEGATIYVKFEPCFNCAKMIINCGIKRVVAEKRYHAAIDSRRILSEAGVDLHVMNDSLETYSNM